MGQGSSRPLPREGQDDKQISALHKACTAFIKNSASKTHRTALQLAIQNAIIDKDLLSPLDDYHQEGTVYHRLAAFKPSDVFQMLMIHANIVAGQHTKPASTAETLTHYTNLARAWSDLFVALQQVRSTKQGGKPYTFASLLQETGPYKPKPYELSAADKTMLLNIFLFMDPSRRNYILHMKMNGVGADRFTKYLGIAARVDTPPTSPTTPVYTLVYKDHLPAHPKEPLTLNL